MKRVWDQIAPPAMFTATGNLTLANSENFLNALDMLKWNVTTQEGIVGTETNSGLNAAIGGAIGGTMGGMLGAAGGAGVGLGISNALNNGTQGSHNGDYGFSGTSKIDANTFPGSNNKPVLGKDEFNKYNVVDWEDSSSEIRVPAGFTPIRGQNVCYADTLPPFDITLTFGELVAA